MKTIEDLIKYKHQKVGVFDSGYDFYVEWLFDQWCKGRDISAPLNEWDECPRAIIVGDIYKTHWDNLDYSFGNDYFQNKFSQTVLDFYKSENFSYLVGHKIYCDESMNLRKVKIKSDNKDELKNLFFVLGGVIVPDNVDLSKINNLFKEHKSGEYKYKFFSGGEKMPECLSSDRFTRLFDFLLEHNIKIHFNAENYLYYALADIIDSIIIPHSKEESDMQKSTLYHFLMMSYDETFNLLLKYEFPSIPHGKEKAFLDDIIRTYTTSFLNNSRPGYFDYESGKQVLVLLKNAKGDELPFIQDNESYVLENTLMFNYIQTGTIFINNGVIFDTELKIEEELNDYEAKYLNTLNCSFVDSKTNLAIQLSDAIVGFIARLLKFITSIPTDEIEETIKMVSNNKQMEINLK